MRTRLGENRNFMYAPCFTPRTDVFFTPNRNNKRHLPRLRDALECVVMLPRTREGRQNCVRFAYRGPLVDRLHVLELKHNVE